jgi:hypothetical protein
MAILRYLVDSIPSATNVVIKTILAFLGDSESRETSHKSP